MSLRPRHEDDAHTELVVAFGFTIIAALIFMSWLFGSVTLRRSHWRSLAYPQGQLALPMPRGYFDRG